MNRSQIGGWCALLILILSGCGDPAMVSSTEPATMPAAEEVNPAPPVIPDRQFKLTDYGAVGDGTTFNTAAFTKAVAAIAKAGGGHLIVSPGIFLTLPFALTSHMDLHLDAGAKLQFPDNFIDYGIPTPDHATRETLFGSVPQALISGNRLTDIAITGRGTIDGAGAIWWIWSDKAARRYPPGRLIYPRPKMIVLRNCQRVHVDGVTLTNSPMFHLVANHCDDVLFENLRIFAPSDAPNTDAMDPLGNRIVVRNCEIDTGDDDVAFNGPTRDAIVEDCTCLHGHGISIGSPTVGGVHHVIVRRCTFDGGDTGVRIKSYRGRGGLVDDISYSDLVMKNLNRAIDVNMLYNGNANVKSDIGPRQASGDTGNLPQVNDVRIWNVSISRVVYAGRIIGLPELPAQGISLTDVHIQADYGLSLQDAVGVKLKNVTLDIAVGPPLTTDNATVTQDN